VKLPFVFSYNNKILMIYLGYFAALVSLIGIVLNAKKNMLCWPIWLISNFLWIGYSLLEMDIPSIVLWIMFSFANIYGWVIWKKLKTNKE